MDEARAWMASGRPDVSNAIRNIAVNGHSREAKRAIHNALPPETAKDVPPWLLNHGPEKDKHVSTKP
jgi:hypothetical protein